jgi:amidase
MNVQEYMSHDAVGLAELIRQREVAPGEVLEAALTRCHAVNPKLNAIIRLLEADARRDVQTGLPAGPLTGVPYLIKDITTQMRGVPTTAASRLFADDIALQDSALVAAYRAAGLLLFGKTNTPEFALHAITEPHLFGITRNPWDFGRTCGGSSGGASSAVAAGIVPAAQASDGGGSIRIPASCCGNFGLKPSRGRVSLAPLGEGWGGLTTLHAITRSVRDSAVLLDVSCRPLPGDIYSLPPPPTSYLEDIARPPDRLRIAVLTTNLFGGTMDPEILDAVRDAAHLCASLGHHVEETGLPIPPEPLTQHALVIIGATVVNILEREAERRGRPIAEDEIEPFTWVLYLMARENSSRQYVQAQQALHAIARRTAPFFQKYDVLLLSTLGQLPIPIGILDNAGSDLAGLTARLQDYAPNTLLFNVTGQPAMSVPLAWSRSGLPIGVQFAARVGEEATLLRLAAQLESARPWAERRPPEIS